VQKLWLNKDRKFLFKFLDVKKHALVAAKINIRIPSKGKPSYKHAKVLTQIAKLPPEKQLLIKRLKAAFVEEEREREDQIREKERLEEEKDRERQERLAKMSEEKRKLLESIDENMPIDEMPDCEIKYKKIVDQFKQSKEKFKDAQFPPTQESLGDNMGGRGIADEWKRASDVEGTTVFKDKIDARDVVQGALGDCYFLSAMSVLGDENVRKCIKCIDSSDHDEKDCGAFWVRFYK
jgi:hypothetical protein